MTETVQLNLTDNASPIGMDAKTFRAAMARLAAAVNVITTTADGQNYGFTASAVCSVTDTPPTLLVCINRTARSHPMITKTRILCVNTLASAQEPIGLVFAGPNATMEERFATGEWGQLTTGAPVLENAAVSFDCKVNSIEQVGTHDVLFCDVIGLRCSDNAQSLVYFDKRFHSLF